MAFTSGGRAPPSLPFEQPAIGASKATGSSAATVRSVLTVELFSHVTLSFVASITQ